MANAIGRTGHVTVRDFDVAMVKVVGAEFIDIRMDGEVAQEYAVNIPGVTGPSSHGGMVPVVFDSPEDAYSAYQLPQIKITRTGMTPAMQRWFPGGHEYLVASAAANDVVSSGGTTGPSLVEKKAWSLPYDINYDVQLKCRLRGQAQAMLGMVGSKLWSYGQIFVIDSLGEDRGYYAFMDSIDTMDEIADVADRSIGYTMSVRVEGELDFVAPTVERTTPKLAVRTGVK